MELRKATLSVLDQLTDFLSQIRKDDYTFSVESLGASIGEHVRHIVEFYICLFEGLEKKEVNYDKRRRDKRIQENRDFAMDRIQEIKEKINTTLLNPELTLKIRYGEIKSSEMAIVTNYQRELVYNIEHTIHHLAIIRTAFNDICEYVKIPEHFGVASSTMRFRQSS